MQKTLRTSSTLPKQKTEHASHAEPIKLKKKSRHAIRYSKISVSELEGDGSEWMDGGRMRAIPFRNRTLRVCWREMDWRKKDRVYGTEYLFFSFWFSVVYVVEGIERWKMREWDDWTIWRSDHLTIWRPIDIDLMIGIWRQQVGCHKVIKWAEEKKKPFRKNRDDHNTM